MITIRRDSVDLKSVRDVGRAPHVAESSERTTFKTYFKSGADRSAQLRMGHWGGMNPSANTRVAHGGSRDGGIPTRAMS